MRVAPRRTAPLLGLVVAAAALPASSCGERDADTRIFDGRGASVTPDRFSRVLDPGTPVDVIADMESADSGTALELRVAGDDG
jgi:hypothetical protein